MLYARGAECAKLSNDALGRFFHGRRYYVITIMVLAVLVCFVGGALMPAKVGAQIGIGKILIITSEPGESEFVKLAETLGLGYEISHELDVLSRISLDHYLAVIVCSLNYPEPNVLTKDQVNGLTQYIQSGGRAYIEFTRPEDSSEFFGLKYERSIKRALYERLYVLNTHSITEGLSFEAILDEQNSAVIPATLVGDAVEILRYDAVLGTYTVYHQKDDVPIGTYQLDIDLEGIHEISGFAQQYGTSAADMPELIEVYTSLDGKAFTKQYEGMFVGPVIRENFPNPVRARYIKIRVTKYKGAHGPVYFHMGRIEVYNKRGTDVARGKNGILTPAPHYGTANILTDGNWDDKTFLLWEMVEEPVRTPGLVVSEYGRGAVVVSTSKFSDFRARHYRLTERWELLLRNIFFYLIPDAHRADIVNRWVPLRAYTEPRVWQIPGEKVTLIVETHPDAGVTVVCDAIKNARLVSKGKGLWEMPLELPEGKYVINIIAETKHGKNTQTVELDILPREVKYKEVLDRNIEWFFEAELLAGENGEGGVYTQRNMAWFDGAPWDGGPKDRLGAQRLDCNVETATMFMLYSELTGDEKYRIIAENILGYIMPKQVVDPNRGSFGAWPWLYVGNDGVFVDDNTKIMAHLLWMYWKTGNQEYLEAGLRTADLFRRISFEDGEAGKWCTFISELDQIGPEGYKSEPRDVVAPFLGVLRWYWAYSVTHADVFAKLGDTVSDIFGTGLGPRGLPLTLWFTQDTALKKKSEELLRKYWQDFLRNPDVRQVGMPRVGQGDFHRAFANDCSVTTDADDPITEQLYVTGYLLTSAWWAYSVTGDELYLDAFHTIGDYLVRIQMQSDDPRIDGAWMRAFDFEHWEYYGANYDPSYGPYSAYTGWCNAPTSTGFALYLLKAQPFPSLSMDTGLGKEILDRISKSTGAEMLMRTNIAEGCKYFLTPNPHHEYDDSGMELTDGVIDGHYSDGRSVGWHLTDSLNVSILLDLGKVYTIDVIQQRYGATIGTYTPDNVDVYVSKDRRQYEKVFSGSPGRNANFYNMELDKPVEARYIRLDLTKAKRQWDEDFMFVGEIQVFEVGK